MIATIDSGGSSAVLEVFADWQLTLEFVTCTFLFKGKMMLVTISDRHNSVDIRNPN